MIKKKYIPIFLLLTFILPVIGSWILFHYHEHFHLKTTNHGHLVKEPVVLNDFQTKWRILYICDDQCDNKFHLLQQIKKALGKDGNRTLVHLNKVQEIPSGYVRNHMIYLVDPHGNLFMFYEDTVNPMDILKDLKKVLGASQIG
jgi:cytochrome oxidase Cu insertion factor (SCO1/SenC/PrrC family)